MQATAFTGKKVDIRDEHYGTSHARAALYRRYKLDVPFRVFLDLIATGEARELPCAVPGRKIFDIYLNRPAVTVRTVVNINGAPDGNHYILTFLPTNWPKAQSRIKRLNGRDKHKYHAVFRNVRLRLENASNEVMKREFKKNPCGQEIASLGTILGDEVPFATQSEARIATQSNAKLDLKEAPNRFPTLAGQLNSLGLNNPRTTSAKTRPRYVDDQ